MLQTQQPQTVFLNDFSGDVMARLHAAGDYLREHPGTTLVIEAGEYIIGDKRARQIREDVFNGVYGLIHNQPCFLLIFHIPKDWI